MKRSPFNEKGDNSVRQCPEWVESLLEIDWCKTQDIHRTLVRTAVTNISSNSVVISQLGVRFMEKLEPFSLSALERLARWNAMTKRSYSTNSRIVTNVSINWLLKMLRAKDSDGEPLKLQIPAKETSPHGRLISEPEWQRMARYSRTHLDLRECVLLHLLRETLLRPSDIVRIRLSNLDLESDPPAIRNLVQQKTKFVASPRVSLETGQLVKKYVKTCKPIEYLFESRPGKQFHRRWPTETLRRITDALGIAGITPRVFRRSGATAWEGKVTTLQLQGGWKSAKSIYSHYLKYREEDHIK
ncbi:MAG: hypothetical protein E3J35_08425, partial [Methanomassiliicoccales archaeon]